jgi:hypothetical protein
MIKVNSCNGLFFKKSYQEVLEGQLELEVFFYKSNLSHPEIPKFQDVNRKKIWTTIFS